MSLGEAAAAAQPVAAVTPGALLDVHGLTTQLRLRSGAFDAVSDVSFSVAQGEVLGIVGESGCGKSMTALSLMQLLPPAARVRQGRALLAGVDLLECGQDGEPLEVVLDRPLLRGQPVSVRDARLRQRRIGRQGARGHAREHHRRDLRAQAQAATLRMEGKRSPAAGTSANRRRSGAREAIDKTATRA